MLWSVVCIDCAWLFGVLVCLVVCLGWCGVLISVVAALMGGLR